MPRTSAGLLPYRVTDSGLELFVGHMGGPFWARKDDGAWSILKGEHGEDEAPEDAARREFSEETGFPSPEGELLPLGDVRQSSKRVAVFAVELPDLDPEAIEPGEFEMEWPPRSGRMARFPEIDRAAWLDPETARRKLVKAQAAFIDRLKAALGS